MTTEQPTNMAHLLAADHQGMRVDYTGMLGQSCRELNRTAPGRAEMLRQLQGHITELGQRFYAGDLKVVDEFLQLYCVAMDARAAISKPLWSIFITVPGEVMVYAAPSKEAAEHMASEHNAEMSEFFSEHPEVLAFHGVTAESVKTVVRPWPHGRDEHAEELAAFDEEWGWDVANNRPAQTKEPQHG